MKAIFFKIIKYLKPKVWAILVAFMVGIHNFYKEEEKSPDDIVFTIENNEKQEDNAPKD